MSKNDKKRIWELTLHIEGNKAQVEALLAAIYSVVGVVITGGITNVEEIKDDGQEG